MAEEPIKITDKAVEAIKYFLDEHVKENDPDKKKTYALRIGVEGGGCAGFQYSMSIDDVVKEGDFVLEKNGAKIVVDPMSMMYVQGSMVDYVDGLTGTGFKITNPNTSGGCGCGHSFSM